ncbi:unnamed protein product [Angiostrongylus costaricensis]|uniref:DUF4457 domain-containing protein n=1 Tax=Angiostrongylus costaricensis TaxID=334426 RepID=A0A158PE62_ANGCS|nr:unnamed protein product [Angiostrongylus costaricensis]
MLSNVFIWLLIHQIPEICLKLRVWDRDAPVALHFLNEDDLMGLTLSAGDGRFQLDGCGADLDWIPGLPNKPEPYVKVLT